MIRRAARAPSQEAAGMEMINIDMSFPPRS
jgi:hypothetical protein